jgi:aspartate carbamoyltransferase catalytic subunit
VKQHVRNGVDFEVWPDNYRFGRKDEIIAALSIDYLCRVQRERSESEVLLSTVCIVRDTRVNEDLATVFGCCPNAADVYPKKNLQN